jgi:CRISPR-associated endonuclease/helicase Cas3
LVSTQVVEAGVDIDFPLVLRAMGPLDRIVQAAGRCNREGKLDRGRLVVFRPSEGGLPHGSYRTAVDITARMLSRNVDLDDPSLYQQYFYDLFRLVDLDEADVQEARRHFRYQETAERFRMVEEDTFDVVVLYDEHAAELVEQARPTERLSRGLIRQLQPYLVALRTYQLHEYETRGLIEQPREGLRVWLGEYDRRRGIVADMPVLIA